MARNHFDGDKKVPLRSPLARIEKRIIMANVGKFPPWIEGYHLTLMTIPLSLGILLFGFLAQYSIHWLWGCSFMLFLQWFTDSFDGALGRHRDTGIPKWGFHMDHLLDFLFMWSVPVGYVFIVQGAYDYMLFAIAFLYGALMMNSFLGFAATNEFKITYLGVGPTEMRLVFIILNTVLIYKGTGHLLEAILPYVLVAFLVSLCIIVYRTQKYIWSIDMAEKRKRSQ